MENCYDVYIGILPKSRLAEIISTDITCPLGQLTIASYLTDRISNLSAKIFDGSKTSISQVIEVVHKYQQQKKRVIAGITLNSGNIQESLTIAKKALPNYSA